MCVRVCVCVCVWALTVHAAGRIEVGVSQGECSVSEANVIIHLLTLLTSTVKHLLCACVGFGTRDSAVNKIGRTLPLRDLMLQG